MIETTDGQAQLLGPYQLSLTFAHECKIARNSDTLRGYFRVQ